jgi:hypothetical protein
LPSTLCCGAARVRRLRPDLQLRACSTALSSTRNGLPELGHRGCGDQVWDRRLPLHHRLKNKDAVKLTTSTTSLTIRGTKFILTLPPTAAPPRGALEGAVNVAPCGGVQPVLENSGQAVQVSTTCRASSVSLGSVPADFATAADYTLARTTGEALGSGGTEGSPGNNPVMRAPAAAMAVARSAAGAAVAVPAEAADSGFGGRGNRTDH